MKPGRKPLDHAILRACAEEGLSQVETAVRLNVRPATICQNAKKHGLKFHHHSRYAQKAPDERTTRMAALYRSGVTLQAIGDEYGITRERVRQLIGKYHGLNGEDGGFIARARLSEARRAANRDTRWLAKNGCTYSQWHYLLALGKDMQVKGIGYSRTPLGAFKSQKNNAGRRGIAWKLTTWQWWTIWQESGHWARRGRGQGYVMCRKGDIGPYAAGNVVIATAVENICEYIFRKHGKKLPIGVERLAAGFRAKRNINGVRFDLGIHSTPELAHAAYLAASPLSEPAAA